MAKAQWFFENPNVGKKWGSIFVEQAKRVLFIHCKFYEYIDRIAGKMRDQGYIVDCFCDENDYCIFEKMIYKVFPQYIHWKSMQRQHQLLHRVSRHKIQYDFVFVLKGANLDQPVLAELKRISRNACFVLYLWDEVERVKSYHSNHNYFEKIYTFSREDAEKYQLKFLPLFFCDEYRFDPNDKINKEIDAFLSAGNHTDRIDFIEKLLPFLNKAALRTEIHLFVGASKNFKHKLLVSLGLVKEPSYMKYSSLSLQQNADLTKRSKVLIDIPHPNQNGLTIRSMEALAAKAKLITTNMDILHYDFFCPENVLVVDRKQPVLNRQFFSTPFAEVPEKMREKYSLGNWTRTILEFSTLEDAGLRSAGGEDSQDDAQ